MTDKSFVYEETVPELLTQMWKVNVELENYDIPARLKHLVELRASQINQCAYCVKLHTAAARRDGETSERLDRLIVWRFVSDFTDEEKAALAWSEALTQLGDSEDLSPIRSALKQHFSDQQIGALTGLVAQINLWNRIQRSVY